MSSPGLTFKSTVVNGLVEEIGWGEWQADSLETHAFGVEGTSSVEGSLAMRDFEVPLIFQGYTTQVLRDNAVLVLERLATKTGSLEIRVAGGTVIFTQNANVKLLSVRRGKSGVDAIHGYWRNLVFVFRQLASTGTQQATP